MSSCRVRGLLAGPPPIYFGLCSTPIAYPADTVAAISAPAARSWASGRDQVWARMTSPISRMPSTSRVVDEVGQAAIFPLCRAVVHHGGAGDYWAATCAPESPP